MSLEALHFDKPTEKFEEEVQEVSEGSNHIENLFDLDEDIHGEKVNLATGEKIDNSTYTETEGVAMREVEADVALGEKPEMVGIDPNDDAAKWLAENGGDPFGK